MLNRNLLKSKIALAGLNDYQVAEQLGMNKSLFSRKMSGKSEFKCSEIQKLIDLLNIEDVVPIFFA